MKLLLIILWIGVCILPGSLLAQSQADAILPEPLPDYVYVAVYDSPPFGMISKSGKYHGLMVELWEDVAKDMGIEYDYQYVSNIQDLMSGLESGEFDLGLGAISITPGRELLIDFSCAINPSGIGMALSKERNHVTFWDKWGPIFVDLAGLLLTLTFLLILSAVLVYLVEKKHHKGVHSEKGIMTITDGLWWAAVTMTTVGYGDKVPMSPFGRVLGIIWIFTGIVIFSLFTANASAKLQSYHYHNHIETVDDLKNLKVGTVTGSSGAEFLIWEQVDFEGMDTMEEAIRILLEGKVDVIVANMHILRYMNESKFKDQLIIGERILHRNNMGIGLPKKSPLRDQINHYLLMELTEPKWQKDVYQFFE